MYLNIRIRYVLLEINWSWTLTWDVFKLDELGRKQETWLSWTLTWDVFKFESYDTYETIATVEL